MATARPNRDAAEKIAAAFGSNPAGVEACLDALLSTPLTAADLRPDDTNAAMATAALRDRVPAGTPLGNRRQRRVAAAKARHRV